MPVIRILVENEIVIRLFYIKQLSARIVDRNNALAFILKEFQFSSVFFANREASVEARNHKHVDLNVVSTQHLSINGFLFIPSLGLKN